MDNNPTPYDKIEQYLLGRLSPAETLEVERTMQEDIRFAQEVALRRLEFDTAGELIAGDIRALFQRLREDEQPPETNKKTFGSRRLLYYMAAAVLLLFVSLLYWKWTEPRPLDLKNKGSETIVKTDTISRQENKKDAFPSKADPTKTPPPELTPAPQAQLKNNSLLIASAEAAYRQSRWNSPGTNLRNSDPAKNNPVASAAEAMRRGRYDEALRLLQNTGKENSLAQMLKAHTYFKLRRFNDAAEVLHVVADLKKPPYQEEAEWLLVLSLLGDGKAGSEAFRAVSGNISKDKGHQFYEDLVALQAELSRNQNIPVAPTSPAFAVNPEMEARINGSRTENLALKISSPQNDARFIPGKNGEVLIRFAGMVESVLAVELTLDIFNNRDAGKPFFSKPLELKKGERTGTMAFDLQQRLNLAQGLYYFTIEQQEGLIAYAGRFIVKN